MTNNNQENYTQKIEEHESSLHFISWREYRGDRQQKRIL